MWLNYLITYLIVYYLFYAYICYPYYKVWTLIVHLNVVGKNIMIEPLVKFVNLFKYLAITLRIRNYPFDIFVCQYRDADFITVNVKQCIFISLVQKRTGFGLLRCQRIKYCLKIRCYQKPNMQLWKIIIFMDKYFTLVLSITFSSFFFYPFLIQCNF